jgi:hypothetical protein
MIANKFSSPREVSRIHDTSSPPTKRTTALKYLAVIRDGGEGRVLTLSDGHLRRTVDHETRTGSVIIGEFSDLHVAERAVRQTLRGWKQDAERKIST